MNVKIEITWVWFGLVWFGLVWFGRLCIVGRISDRFLALQ